MRVIHVLRVGGPCGVSKKTQAQGVVVPTRTGLKNGSAPPRPTHIVHSKDYTVYSTSACVCSGAAASMPGCWGCGRRAVKVGLRGGRAAHPFREVPSPLVAPRTARQWEMSPCPRCPSLLQLLSRPGPARAASLRGQKALSCLVPGVSSTNTWERLGSRRLRTTRGERSPPSTPIVLAGALRALKTIGADEPHPRSGGWLWTATSS
jgi:hypothetical protein